MDNDLGEAQRAIALVEQKFLDGLDWESRLEFEEVKRGVKDELTLLAERTEGMEAPPGPEIFVRKPGLRDEPDEILQATMDLRADSPGYRSHCSCLCRLSPNSGAALRAAVPFALGGGKAGAAFLRRRR